MKCYAQRLARQRVGGRSSAGAEDSGTKALRAPPVSDRGLNEGRGDGADGSPTAVRHDAASRLQTSLAPVKRPVSEKRLAANRRNALKSTGPRTLEGKRRSSQNALKHGLRARALSVFSEKPMSMSYSPVLPGECGATFETIKGELYDEFHPRTAMETWLVDSIATQLWRLMRTNEIERRLIEAEGRRAALARQEAMNNANAVDAIDTELTPAGVLAEIFGQNHPHGGMMLLTRYQATMQRLMMGLLIRLQSLRQRKNDDLYSREDREKPRRDEYGPGWDWALKSENRKREDVKREEAKSPDEPCTSGGAMAGLTGRAERAADTADSSKDDGADIESASEVATPRSESSGESRFDESIEPRQARMPAPPERGSLSRRIVTAGEPARGTGGKQGESQMKRSQPDPRFGQETPCSQAGNAFGRRNALAEV